ncbi:MAG: coproporphyrinogen III oxidase, partial [Pseudomonadota bacterium]
MKIVSFVNEAREKLIEKLLEASGTGKLTRENVPFNVGTADVAVIRGGCIEKAAITHLVMNRITPPEAASPVDYMVFQMEIFPENPCCPMGHFNTEWALTGSGPYHMNLDLFPAVPCRQELAHARAAMDKVADAFKTDKNKMREGLDDQYNMAHWDAPLASMTGCKLMHLAEDKVDLFIAAYHAFFEAYLEILRSAKSRNYSEADTILKLKRNGKWLEYLTLKDPAVKMG